MLGEIRRSERPLFAAARKVSTSGFVPPLPRFARDERGTRLRGDHAQAKGESAMTIEPNPIAL
jgi:hypothetical protein